MTGRFCLSRRLIPSAVHNMSEGVRKQLVLPKRHGLKGGTLDKDAFRRIIPILAAKVPPEKAGILLKAPALKRCALFVQASIDAGTRAYDTVFYQIFNRCCEG